MVRVQGMPMQAAERRRLEQEQLKAERINNIIECTFGLFAEKGIESISMNEIASQAEIGVASLYRYFSTKEDLAIECAIYAWKMEADNFKKYFATSEYDMFSGYEQIKCLLEIFPEALVSQSSFFRFIYYFDAFIKKEKVSQARLHNYEEAINVLKDVVICAIEKGKKDGSITFTSATNLSLRGATTNELYFSMMHSLFSMAQKLSLSGEMLYMDLEVKPEKQMELLVQFILAALK